MLPATEQEKRRNPITWLLETQALNEAPNRNAKIQLLSIVCGKDADDQYFISKMNLLICLKG